MIDQSRSYPWMTVMVILVALVSTVWIVDRIRSYDADPPARTDERAAVPGELGEDAVCMPSASRSVDLDRRDRRDDAETSPPMTRAPEDMEISETPPIDGDLGIDTRLELEVAVDGPAAAPPLDETSLQPPDLHRSLDLFGPMDAVAAGDFDISVPAPPPGSEIDSSSRDVESKIDELARTASRTINRVDRLGRRVMSGARITPPASRRSRQPETYRPEARLAPSWIRGNPGARLEISF